MATKIDVLRDEFSRIGCTPPKDPFKPRLYVGWHFTRILVSGINEDVFKYEVLREILKEIPDGAGEEVFWRKVEATDLEALADRLNL